MDTCEIYEQPAFRAIVVRSNIRAFKMPVEFPKLFKSLVAHLNTQKASMEGPPYTAYYRLDWNVLLRKKNFFFRLLDSFTQVWDVELGLPIGGHANEQGNITHRRVEAFTAASCLHIGPYANLGESYEKLHRWISEQNLNVQNMSYELYLNDPHETPTEELQTRILVPLAS